jgi:hypothetical protein
MQEIRSFEAFWENLNYPLAFTVLRGDGGASIEDFWYRKSAGEIPGG